MPNVPAHLPLPTRDVSIFSQNRKRAAVRWNGGLGVIALIGGQQFAFAPPTLLSIHGLRDRRDINKYIIKKGVHEARWPGFGCAVGDEMKHMQELQWHPW